MVEEHGQNPMNVRKTIGSTIPYHPLKFTIFTNVIPIWWHHGLSRENITWFLHSERFSFAGSLGAELFRASLGERLDLWF